MQSSEFSGNGDGATLSAHGTIASPGCVEPVHKGSFEADSAAVATPVTTIFNSWRTHEVGLYPEKLSMAMVIAGQTCPLEVGLIDGASMPVTVSSPGCVVR